MAVGGGLGEECACDGAGRCADAAVMKSQDVSASTGVITSNDVSCRVILKIVSFPIGYASVR